MLSMLPGLIGWLTTYCMHAVTHTQAFTAPTNAGGARFLNLHEYQSKDLMEKYGVSVQVGRMAASEAEAKSIATEILTNSTTCQSIA